MHYRGRKRPELLMWGDFIIIRYPFSKAANNGLGIGHVMFVHVIPLKGFNKRFGYAITPETSDRGKFTHKTTFMSK